VQVGLTTQTINTANGSDANVTTGRTNNFTVLQGQTKDDIDAGFTVCGGCRASVTPQTQHNAGTTGVQADNDTNNNVKLADQADLRYARNAVSIYPNPSTTGELTVKVFTNAEGTPATVLVLDAIGKQIATQQTVLSSGTNYIRLDVTTLPTGTYFVKVLANGINFDAQRLVRISE
jgi:hypothetical protein